VDLTERCGQSVPEKSGTLFFEVVGEFVEGKVGFGGEVAKTANRRVAGEGRELVDKGDCVRFFGGYFLEVEVVECRLNRRETVEEVAK